MPNAVTALLDHLNAGDDASRTALDEALAGADLAAARLSAKDDPASADAAAAVLGRLVLDGAEDADFIDAAKAAAQRAPRDGGGDEVALLAGGTIWRKTGEAKLAEPYFRRVRRTNAADPRVLAFYRELFGGQSGASQLMQVLVQARRASKDDPARRFELAQEMAQLAEDKLGSPERAIEVWRSVMREDGYDERAGQALQRLYRDTGKWTALVDLLKDDVERVAAGSEHDAMRIAKLLEIAELYRDRLKLDGLVLGTLQRILDIDPQHEASLEALAETYAKAGRFNDLLGVYTRRIEAAEQAQDTERRIELLRKVAEIWVERLGNPQRALEPLHTVLSLAPGDEPARALLARIHEQRRDWRALIALRREELDHKEGDAALQLRSDLARLAEEKLGDRREAIVAWNEVLQNHGDVVDALDALARLYERESRWANAAEILHRKLPSASRDEAVIVLGHLGGLYSDRLHSDSDARLVWSELLRLVPQHDRATRRLRDLYVAAGDWDALTDLYEAQGRLVDVIDVLQGAADRIGDTEPRVALYRRIAALSRDRLGQPERALKALERTLAIQPDNFDVARELLPIYREQSNWARLMSTYEVLLAAAQTDDERLELIAAMRGVAEDQLASPALTLQWAARAYQIRPTDAELRQGLEKAAEEADGWDELVGIYEARIGGDGVADQEHLQLLDRLAVIARDRLFKPDDAQRYYRRIIALDPNNDQAMTALEEIYSSTRRWEDLSEVYRRRLEVTTETDARLTTLRGLSRLQEQQLGDLAGAVDSHAAILALAPEEDNSLLALARIHRNRGNWVELADILSRTLERTESAATRVPLMFELSQIRAQRLSQSDEAVAGFLGVLELEPMHRETVAALETLRTSDPSTSLAVMRGLLPYYRRVEDRPREAEAMEVIVAAEDDVEMRRDLLTQLAGTYERMDDRRDDALRIRGELFRAVPGNYDGRKTLQRLGAELGRLEDVARAYEEQLSGLAQDAELAEAEGRTLAREETTLRRDMLLEYAAMLRDSLGRPEDAETAYAEVLEQDETHQGAYEQLEALLSARSANEELVALYRRRADVTFNQGEQRELLSRIIQISRTLLGDRATAIATAEELLDLIPDDLATIKLLAQMYAEGADENPSDQVQLEELMGRWAELTDDADERRELMVRRASLRMHALSDEFGAVDLLGQVLGETPDDEAARGLLEALLDVPSVQLQACALLEPIYSQRGDHHGRIRVLQVRRSQAADSGSTDQAVTHLIQIARLREGELADGPGAFEAMREAYLLDPRRLDTREEVQRLALAQNRASDLAGVWRSALQSDLAADKALQIDLTQRVAVLLDETIGDQELARAAYARLLSLDPPDATVAHRAVEALCRLHLEAGDGVQLIEAKRALLRFTDAQAEQVAIRLEIASIQEQLGDRVGAAMTYSEVLDMEVDNVAALEALERLFLEEGEWVRLCEVLQHRIEVTPDPRLRAPVWRQIGEIQRDQLADAHRAIAAFQSVVDLKVGREETAYALQSLVGLDEQLERWPDVEENLRRLVTLAETDNDRVELQLMTAQVVGDRLGRHGDALELLKRVLDLDPHDERARDAVRARLEDDDTYERAMRILMPLYEAEQNWPALVELEELQARKQPSGRRRLQALLRVASTQEERIGDPERAFSVLCEAMHEAADQPELAEILEKVERLGAEPHRAEALLEGYGRTVDHILDSDLQQRVCTAMGDVALSRLGNLAAAREAFERVHEMAPDDATALEALDRIYLEQQDFEPLAQLLQHRAERAADEADRDNMLMRAAEIYRDQLGDAEGSIQLYERLSSAALGRDEVQAVLEPLYEQTERFRELAAQLNRKLARLEGRDAVDVHLRLGRLYGDKLGDPEAGIRHLATALKLDPDHAVGTDELGRYLEDESMRRQVAEMLEPVFAAVAEWGRLIQIQEIRLADAPDEATRVQILLKIARIEEDQLEDLDKAFDSYTRVFKEQPGNTTVRDQLSRLSGVLARTDDYAELLTEHVTTTAADDNSDEVLTIVSEASDLWAGSLRQPERAVPLLQRIREARPNDTTVFGALESALTQSENWAELAEAYWREVDTASEERRQIEVLRKLATLASELLEDPEEAGRAYRRMLDIRPDNDLARTRLEQIYESTERWPELIELLRERIDHTEGGERINAIHAQIADVQEGQLDEPEAAVDTLEVMLAEIADDADAVARLERIAVARGPLRPRILSILRPIYERQGNVRRLVEVDEWQLGHTEDPGTRHELYREMASLLQRAGDGGEAAFRTLCRALSEPGPQDAIEALDAEVERLATDYDLEGELAESLVSAADAEALAGDEDRRLSLLVRGAKTFQQRGDATRAIEILHAALELSPEHGDALTLLDMALSRAGQFEDLGQVLAMRARIAEDDSERLALLRRHGILLEDTLGEREAATAVWKDLLDIEPSDREALQRLSRAHETAGRHPELAEILQRSVENSDDPTERRQLRLQLAALQRGALDDRSAEIDVLRTQLTEDATDDGVLGLLAEALIAEERHAEAADVFAERGTITSDDEQRAGFALDAARLFAGPLEDSASALERYEQVVTLMPGHADALTDLVQLAVSPDTAERAGTLVMPQLQAAGRFEELARVLDARVQTTSDPEDKARTLGQLASVRLEQLGDMAGALESLVILIDVVQADGLRAVLEDAGKLAVHLGSAPTYIEMLAQRAADPDRDPAARITMATYAASVAEEIVGEPERALALLTPLLTDGLATEAVCAEVERLGRHVGATAAVEQALRESARQAEDPSTQGAALGRLGELLLEQQQWPEALEAFREAFELTQDASAVRGMEAILQHAGDDAPSGLLDVLDGAYEAGADRPGQARVLERRLLDTDPSSQPALLEQLASIYDEGGGSQDQALDAWSRLLRHDAESERATTRILELGASTGQLGQAAESMLAAVAAAVDAGRPTQALALRTAQTLQGELGDPTRATAVLQVVLSDNPENLEALELLVASARDAGDARGYHDALVRNAQVQADPLQSAMRWKEAAAVAEGPLADADLATTDLEEVLAADESDGESWARLMDLLARAEKYEALADIVSRRVMICDGPDERQQLRRRLADLYVQRLDRSEDAIVVYQDMIGDRPDDTQALADLEQVLRRAEQWDDVRDTLERRLEVVDGQDRVETLLQLGVVAETKLDDSIDAIDRYQLLVSEQPEHAQASTALERLLRGEERYVDLAELLETRMTRQRESGDADGFRRTGSELAMLLAEELGHSERAEDILQQLLELDPTYVPAILSLASVYETRGDDEAMRQALQRAAGYNPAGTEGAALQLRLAKLAGDDEDTRRGHLTAALELDPGCVPALDALLGLARRDDDVAQVIALLELKAMAAPDPDDRTAIALERVDLMLGQPGQAEAALDVLAPMYEAVQDDVGINRRIANALYTADRFEEAADMYNWLVEVGRRGKRNKILAHDLTRLARIRLLAEDRDGARELLLEAYRIDTTNVETLMTLGSLHEGRDEWREALKIYRTMLLQNADQSGLMRRGDIYINLARAHLALEERPKARAMLRRGLEEDSQHPELANQLQALGD